MTQLATARTVFSSGRIQPGSEDAGFIKEMEDLFASRPLPGDNSN